MKERLKKIRESNFYKIWLSPLINLLFSVFGNTAGIWLGFVLINYILFGIWDSLTWPGVKELIADGVILLISFSFLTSVLYQSTRRAKINFFNIISSFMLVVAALYYTRVILIEQSSKDILNDASINFVSVTMFFGSIILLYANLVYDKYVEYSSPRENRKDDLEKLKSQVG